MLKSVLAAAAFWATTVSGAVANEGWQGVWVPAAEPCPSEHALQSLSSGGIMQGPHWFLFEDAYCEALRGDPFEGAKTWTVVGLCRSSGSLQSETWTFTTNGQNLAIVDRKPQAPQEVKLCGG